MLEAVLDGAAVGLGVVLTGLCDGLFEMLLLGLLEELIVGITVGGTLWVFDGEFVPLSYWNVTTAVAGLEFKSID